MLRVGRCLGPAKNLSFQGAHDLDPFIEEHAEQFRVGDLSRPGPGRPLGPPAPIGVPRNASRARGKASLRSGSIGNLVGARCSTAGQLSVSAQSLMPLARLIHE